MEGNLIFKCNKCNNNILNNYTQKDIETKNSLVLKCQNCGYEETILTSEIIKEMKKQAEKQAVEQLNKIFSRK